MKKRLLKKALFATCLLAVTLVTMEVGIRLWGYSERHIYDPIYTPFDQSEDIPYVHKANLVNARARGLAIINTDSLGLRASIAGLRYGPKQKNEYRIAIVGDSGVFGEGVQNTEDTFAQVLEDRLNHDQTAVKVRVFNYGASGYSVKEMAATLEHRMLEIDPDLVVMTIIDHDFVLTRTPTLDSSGYLVEKTRTDGLLSYPMVRETLRHIHLSHVTNDLSHWWFRAGNDAMEKLRNDELPESYLYVRRFKEIAEAHNRPYLVVFRPGSWPAQLRRVSEELRRDGISFVDLSSLRDEFSREQFRASRFDPHPSAAVHRRIGESLADYVHRVQWEKVEKPLHDGERFYSRSSSLLSIGNS